MKKFIMITCKEATLAIIKKEEGKISLTERIRLLIHLAICKFCKMFEKQNKLISINSIQISSQESLTAKEKEDLEKNLQ